MNMMKDVHVYSVQHGIRNYYGGLLTDIDHIHLGAIQSKCGPWYESGRQTWYINMINSEKFKISQEYIGTKNSEFDFEYDAG